MTEKATEWISRHGDKPFFMHISYVRPHPPRRNPAGYHDLYSEEQVGPFTGFPDPSMEAAFHPLNRLLVGFPSTAAPQDERERRQLRATYYGAQKEVDDHLGRLFGFLDREGPGPQHSGRFDQRSRRDGWGPLAGGKMRLLGRELSYPPRGGGPVGRGGRHPGPGGRRTDRIGGRGGHGARLAGAGDPGAGRRLAAHPVPEGGGGAAALEAIGPLGMGFPLPPVPAWPSTWGSPPSTARWLWAARAGAKYVQFAADVDKMPPLLFDLRADPAQLANVTAESRSWRSRWRRTCCAGGCATGSARSRVVT